MTTVVQLLHDGRKTIESEAGRYLNLGDLIRSVFVLIKILFFRQADEKELLNSARLNDLIVGIKLLSSVKNVFHP